MSTARPAGAFAATASPRSYLADLERRFAEREGDVQAFVPEEGRFARLRSDAASLSERFAGAAQPPPLFGVPVGVKDIFHVDGFATGGGSRLPPEELAGEQAESVTRLLAAGALIAGKTVSTEFAYFAPGPTRNPHDLARTPGGSSSGSAAAVAAGLCPLALGTQTIGSISRPASYCGVVGYKPSYERISRAGIIPLSPSLDHVGTFTEDVAGAEVAASVLCHDWRGAARPERRPVLAVPEGPFLGRAEESGRRLFGETCAHLAAAGFDVLPVAAFGDLDAIEARHRTMVAAEAARVHDEWFARHADLYERRTAELIRAGQAVRADELDEALAGRERLRAELTAAMDDHEIDLWLSPGAVGVAPEGLESTGDPVMNLPWTHSGLPTICLPAAPDALGLPMGLQVAGRWHADEELLGWAATLEEALA